MVKKIFAPILVFALVCALLPASFPGFAPVHLESPLRIGRWMPLIHVVHNAYFLWRPEFIVRMLNEIGGAGGMPTRVEFFLMALGFYLLFARIRADHPVGSVVAALGIPLVVGLWFGKDVSLVPPMTVFPWTVLSVLRLRAATNKVSLFLMLVTGAWLADSAQNLALLYVLAVLGAAEAIPVAQESTTIASKAKVWAWLCLLAPALLQLWLMPALPFPDYPVLARVAPDDGIRGIIRPLVGPDTEIPSLDRVALREALRPVVAGLICFWLLLMLSLRRSMRHSRFGIIAGALILSVVFDVLPSEDLAIVGPAAALSRMLPKLFLLPVSPVLVALSFAMALLAAAKERQLVRALAFVPLMFIVQSVSSPLHTFAIFADNDFKPFLVAAESPVEVRSQALQTLLSPSYAVAKEVGAEMFSNRARYEALHFKTPSAEHSKVRGWPDGNDTAFSALIDRDLQTRWSTNRGEQRGDEWIEIFFDAPKRLSGVEVNSGKYLADFARGVRLSYVSRCAPPSGKGPDKPALDWITAGNYPSWQGEIRYTPQGYPYYGSQSVFRQYFPEPIEAQCLLIEQTGKFQSFEWSVAEVRVARADSESQD